MASQDQVINKILDILTTKQGAPQKFYAGVKDQQCQPDGQTLCPGGNTCLDSPAEAVWLAGSVADQILSDKSVKDARGYELFSRLLDNQSDMSISDDI